MSDRKKLEEMAKGFFPEHANSLIDLLVRVAEEAIEGVEARRDAEWEKAVRDVCGDDQLARFTVRQGMVCDEILKRMGRT